MPARPTPCWSRRVSPGRRAAPKARRYFSCPAPRPGRGLAAAKAVTGRAGRFVGQEAVQLHGGMGMTDELKVSHWFKRLTAAQLMFGDSDTHLQRYAALTRA